MLTELAELGQRARKHKRITNAVNFLNLNLLATAFHSLKRDAAVGVDGVTYKDYENNLKDNLQDLYQRVRTQKYQAPPVRRVYIPKGNGKQRPIGIGTLEDRIVQKAVAWMLSVIYEMDFQECSHGFRPKRSCHTALKRLYEVLIERNSRYVVEADVKGCFDNVNHEWLRKFLRHRIADKGMLRLVDKWQKAGVMENGVLIRNEDGVPQGGPVSPVLANIYLHYVLDLWFELRFVKECKGKASLTRYADDFVAVFEEQQDAKRFRAELDKRFTAFALEIAPEKTRVIAFGRYALYYLAKQNKRPESFDFLGFTHYCARSRKGMVIISRKPAKKRRERFIKRIKRWLLQNRHLPVRKQQTHLKEALIGHYQYYGLRNCTNSLSGVRERIKKYWKQSLVKRSQKANRTCTWEILNAKEWFQLPRPRVYNPTV
jgi:group II intron reverse transcriptase/maturase